MKFAGFLLRIHADCSGKPPAVHGHRAIRCAPYRGARRRRPLARQPSEFVPLGGDHLDESAYIVFSLGDEGAGAYGTT
jgi:hypothetical protein